MRRPGTACAGARMGEVWVQARIILGERWFLVTMAVTAVVLVPPALLHARWSGWGASRATAAALSALGAALVVGATLGRGGVAMSWRRDCLLQPGLSLTGAEAKLNVALFVPAVFFGVLAWRRVVVTLVVAVGASVLIEQVQRVTSLGVCQTSDVVQNVAGALVAAVAGHLVARLTPARTTSVTPTGSRDEG